MNVFAFLFSCLLICFGMLLVGVYFFQRRVREQSIDFSLESHKIDCGGDEPIPCIVDSNCGLCGVEIKCIDGVCKAPVTISQSRCDNSKGLYFVKQNNILGSEWSCFNTKQNIQNDLGQLHEWVCYGGVYDYESGQCICRDERISKVISNVPLCIREQDLLKL